LGHICALLHSTRVNLRKESFNEEKAVDLKKEEKKKRLRETLKSQAVKIANMQREITRADSNV